MYRSAKLRRFQPGEGTSRGLLCDCENFVKVRSFPAHSASLNIWTLCPPSSPLPPSGMWNLPDLYISSTEPKFSGFLSKKNSGGSPGTNSSHSCSMSATRAQDISRPSRVPGNRRNELLKVEQSHFNTGSK